MFGGLVLYGMASGDWAHVGAFLVLYATVAPWVSAWLNRKGA